jgi:hypothetical protein
VGGYTVSATAGSFQAQTTIQVTDRSFSGSSGSEIQIDAGGPGIAGWSFAGVAALDLQAAASFCDARLQTASHVFVNPSLDGGLTWKGARRADHASAQADAWDSSVAVDGQGTLVVSWCDQRALETGAVYATVSTDGGQTFPGADVRVDAAAARASACGSTRTAISSGRFFVAWIDQRFAATGDTVFIARSTDGGKTFAEQQLDTHTSGASPWSVAAPLSLVASGSDVSVLWTEQQGGTSNVVVASSQDGGATFARTTLNGAQVASVSDARLVASGGVLHAAWRDDRAGSATKPFLRNSTDGGVTWSAEASPAFGAAKAQVSALSIAAAGNEVIIFVSAQDQGAANVVPQVARSADFGTTFTFTGALPQGTSDSVRSPEAAAQGSGVLASWNEVTYSSGERAALSKDGGATFPTASKVSASSAADGLFGPTRSVFAGAGRFYVLWEEARGTPSSPSHLWLVVTQ